jgi:hypothetical protein
MQTRKTLMIASMLSALMGTPVMAQTVTQAGGAAAEPETVFKNASPGRSEITGWFLAPSYAATSFGGTVAQSPGLRGGIYIDRRLAIGLALNGIGSDQSSFAEKQIQNVGTYGGFLVQYVLQSNSLLHVSLESTLGSGRWCNRVGDADATHREGCDGRAFLMFEPVANLELNVSRHLRVATGVGYRFTAAGTGNGPSSGDMSGLVARTSLVFGSF